MKLTKTFTAGEIADLIGATVLGESERLVTGINEIHKVEEGDLTFVDFHKYYKKVLSSAASIVIIDQAFEVPANKTLLVCESPFKAYNSLAKKFRPEKLKGSRAGKLAYHKSETAQIAESALIMPGAYIGEDVIIGANTVVYPNVVINDHTSIGENVIIHANTTIGTDAFYYKKTMDSAQKANYEKMHTIGRVIIEDEVEIGANCTVDSGVSGITHIGKGTKIDNLVMIAHGVEIGKNCLIAAQVGIAGKTILEDGVTIWAQAGISKSLHLAENSVVLAKSGLGKDTEKGKTYFGIPAIDARTAWKDIANIRRLRME